MKHDHTSTKYEEQT